MENLTLLFRQKRPHEYRQSGEGCFKVLTQLPILLSYYDLGQKQVTAEDFGDDELWL